MESNKLLPKNQHGFRAKRSTMSAWANLQRDWTQNTDDKKVTGNIIPNPNINIMHVIPYFLNYKSLVLKRNKYLLTYLPQSQ